MRVMEEMQAHAGEAAQFLKGLASSHRLMILCQLAEGEKSVSTLIEATGLAQTSMSQHLSKLRQEGLVEYRRDHRTLYYAIVHPAVLRVMRVMHEEFCEKNRRI